jgi:hypothetical protein
VNESTRASAWSQPGIESTGTNADETNVSGKTIVKPSAFEASGEEAASGERDDPGEGVADREESPSPAITSGAKTEPGRDRP